MANQPQQPKNHQDILVDIEAQRLNLERYRTDLEKHRADIDRQRFFLERWQIDIGKTRENQFSVGLSSVEFGKFALRGAFIINGGAIIALPAFAQLLGTVHVTFLASALTIFALGLVASSTAMFFGYLSLSRSSRSLEVAGERSAVSLNNETLMLEEEVEPLATLRAGKQIKIRKQLDDLFTRRSEHQKKSNFFETVAFCAGALSVALFILGAGIGAFTLLTTPTFH